jgi:hypothetical protein
MRSPPMLHDVFSQFLTPAVFRQAHRVWRAVHQPSRWALAPVVWVALTMTWCAGQSQEERFALARAAYVAHHQRGRRPGHTLAGFLRAFARVPLPVWQALAEGVRQHLRQRFVASLRVGGWLPLACDGTRLECPRAAELQQRLGEAGKPGSAPMIYLTTLVLLPVGVVWSWCWGKGTASEHHHLRQLLRTLPRSSLIVADAAYLGYELFVAIQQARAAFLVRLSSKAYLYTASQTPLAKWTEGRVYYWPTKIRQGGRPPLEARLLRIKGKQSDVWLLMSVLDSAALSRRTIGQLYRWRWRNEGLFRDYKRLLRKTKLSSRTVRLVHREAEASLLALQVMLALGMQRPANGSAAQAGSPRQELLRLRGAIQAALRELGPRQMAQYQRRHSVVRSASRSQRISAKVRQEWPRRKDHRPPKPPHLRPMNQALKAKLNKALKTE